VDAMLAKRAGRTEGVRRVTCRTRGSDHCGPASSCAGVAEGSGKRARGCQARLISVDQEDKVPSSGATGELAGVEACCGNVRPHGEHGNQEARDETRMSRTRESSPGAQWCAQKGRRRSTVAEIRCFLAGIRDRNGEFPRD
jgi:hypothetical protein